MTCVGAYNTNAQQHAKVPVGKTPSLSLQRRHKGVGMSHEGQLTPLLLSQMQVVLYGSLYFSVIVNYDNVILWIILNQYHN